MPDFLVSFSIIGKVWPDNPDCFPDFSNPVTDQWWIDCISDWHDLIAFDGLWIDMNEPANFVTGSIHGCPSNRLNEPPYVPAIGRY